MYKVTFTGIIKSMARKWDKAKNAVKFHVTGLSSGIRNYGDTLLFILALVVLAALLSRQSDKGAAAGVQIFRPAAPSLVFTQWWEGKPEQGALLDLVHEFESRHNGIKVVLNTRPYEELRRDLFNPGGDASLGNTPLGDIIALDPLWVPELLERGIIKIPQAGAAEPEFAHAAGELALLSFINVLYYNLGILKEAGFSRPPKDRGEFLNYARAVAGGGGRTWGLALGLNSSRGIYDDVFPWIWASGGQLFTGGKPALDSRQLIEGLSFLAALNGEGLIAPGAFSSDAGGKLDDFISGRAAFMIAPSRDIAFVMERMGAEAFSVSSIPSPDNYAGRALYGSAGWAAALNPASALNEEARLFIDFLAGEAPALSEKILSSPGNGALSQDPVYSKVWDIAIAGENARDFTGLPWTVLEEIFKEELFNLFTGKNTPAETAGAIQKRCGAALSSPN